MRLLSLVLTLGCSWQPPSPAAEPTEPTPRSSAERPEAAVATSAEVRRGDELVEYEAGSGLARISHLARGEGAYIGRLWLAPGASVPEHQDASEEFIHVLAGGGRITIDGQTHRIRAGDTVYMPAGSTVSYANGEVELVALQVFAGPAPARKYDAWEPHAP